MTVQDVQPARSPAGTFSVAIAVLTLLVEAGGVAAGLLGANAGWVGLMLVGGTLPAAAGLVFGAISFMRREPQTILGHLGLWLNGWIAVFATPLAMAWTLLMKR